MPDPETTPLDEPHVAPRGNGGAVLPPGPSAWKAAALLLGLILLLALAYASPLRPYLGHVRELSLRIRAMGWPAPFVFTLAGGLLVAVGLPRLLYCAFGGLVFGFVEGLLLSQVGTVLGYYLVFLTVRRGGRFFARYERPALRRLADLVRRQGVPAVILARQLPIHGMATNILLALSPVSVPAFLTGTAIGLLPEAVPCALIGSGAAQSSLSASAGALIAGAVLLALAWIGLGAYRRAQARLAPAPSAGAMEP